MSNITKQHWTQRLSDALDRQYLEQRRIDLEVEAAVTAHVFNEAAGFKWMNLVPATDLEASDTIVELKLTDILDAAITGQWVPA